MTTIAEKLEARTERIPFSGCHIWTGAQNGVGYGVIGISMTKPRRTKILYMHRAAWELVHGPIPDGMCVLHRCDVPSCVNVDHLFIGTKKDNSRDMAAKGRGRPGHMVGSANGQSKLDADKVARIRNDKRPSHFIAAEFGVSGALVRQIRRGVAWKCLL